MSWLNEITTQLQEVMPGGYLPRSSPASEPVAWATLALAQAEKPLDAKKGADWLAGIQQRNGAVGVNAEHPTPAWTTSLAILAWKAASADLPQAGYDHSIEKAVDWSLQSKGRTTSRKKQIGHDTTLVGWSWAAETHSWLEPTAMFVAALRSAGASDHPRVREGVRLLLDRLLPSGGANYGNTIVLGQELLPHLQPTGIVLWALAGESFDDGRIEKSLDYLHRSMDDQTPTASLAFGVLGLSAYDRRPTHAEAWLEKAYRREQLRGGSPHKLALLALAGHANQSRLKTFAKVGAPGREPR